MNVTEYSLDIAAFQQLCSLTFIYWIHWDRKERQIACDEVIRRTDFNLHRALYSIAQLTGTRFNIKGQSWRAVKCIWRALSLLLVYVTQPVPGTRVNVKPLINWQLATKIEYNLHATYLALSINGSLYMCKCSSKTTRKIFVVLFGYINFDNIFGICRSF